MRRTTVFLPDEIADELQDAARRTGQAQSELLREALAAYLPQHARPWPSSVGVAHRSQVEGVTSENAKAWVRDEWADGLDSRPGADR